MNRKLKVLMFVCLFASHVIVVFTFFKIATIGSMTWVEPIDLVLYPELILSIFVLVLSIMFGVEKIRAWK